MERHPNHSWAIIEQQTWTMFLKDRIRYEGYKGGNHNSNSSDRHNRDNWVKVPEPCRHYNRGLCTNKACKYEHRCSYCFKFGHNVLNCRKAAADCEKKSPGGGSHQQMQGSRNSPAHAPE